MEIHAMAIQKDIAKKNTDNSITKRPKSMNNKLKPFSVFHSALIIGELFKAKDIHDLIDNRLPKKVLNNWEIISFIDSENRNISVTRSFMDDDKMSLDETIQDWIDNGNTLEPVLALNPKIKNGSLTVILSEHAFTPANI